MTNKDWLVGFSGGAVLTCALMILLQPRLVSLGVEQSRLVLVGVAALGILVIVLAGITEMSKRR